MRAFTSVATALCLPLLAVAVSAQDLEPRVQTSGANAAPISSDTKSKDTPAAKPSAASARPAAPAAAAGAAPKAGKASDHIQLDTTQISGNRELPKVMYVVPWRKADPENSPAGRSTACSTRHSPRWIAMFSGARTAITPRCRASRGPPGHSPERPAKSRRRQHPRMRSRSR